MPLNLRQPLYIRVEEIDQQQAILIQVTMGVVQNSKLVRWRGQVHQGVAGAEGEGESLIVDLEIT